MHETLFEIHRTQDQFITQIDMLTQRIVELQMAVLGNNSQQQQSVNNTSQQQHQTTSQQSTIHLNYNNKNNNDTLSQYGSMVDSPSTQLRQLCNSTIMSSTSVVAISSTSSPTISKSNFSVPTTHAQQQYIQQLQQQAYINHLSVPSAITCVSTSSPTKTIIEQPFQISMIVPFKETTTKISYNNEQKPSQQKHAEISIYNEMARDVTQQPANINNNQYVPYNQQHRQMSSLYINDTINSENTQQQQNYFDDINQQQQTTRNVETYLDDKMQSADNENDSASSALLITHQR